MNILFVCSQNKWRSLTAEHIFSQKPGLQVRSVGTSSSARRVISASDIIWSDLIFVMEKRHKEMLLQNFSSEIAERTVVTLDIPDEFEYMDLDLVEMLERGVEPYL